jgi:hypothetical protein
MSKGNIRKLLAASALACVASASQAAVVENWNYSIDMEWLLTGVNKPVFGPSTDPYSAPRRSSTTLSWGYFGGVDGMVSGPGASAFYNRSSLIITKPNGSGQLGTGGAVEQVNMFTHTNNEILASYAALTEATMRVSVNLTPTDKTYPVETLTKDFKIFFYETPNIGGTCAWGNCDDDLFAFVMMPQIYDLYTYGGQTYKFEYFQTSGPNAITEFSADICSAISDGAVTTSCYGFKTPESAQTTLQFGFKVTAVPEPETYAMLLAGLSLVGAVVSRRRNNVIRN